MFRKAVIVLLFVLLAAICASACAETLTLPDDLKEIGEKAFFGDKKLDEVIIPDHVSKIPSLAFAESSIKRISIPASVIDIVEDAFDGVNDLTVVAPEGSKAQEYAQEDAQKNRGFKWESAPLFQSVFFGNYPQDKDGGIKPIEWYVLDRNGDKAFLLSRYCLDFKEYFNHKDGTGRSGWSSSEIRDWLNDRNDGFIAKAFTNQERNAIQTTQVDYGYSQDDPHYSVMATFIEEHRYATDYVFLLSYQESQRYFPADHESDPNPARVAKATDYVKALADEYQATITLDIDVTGIEADGACNWWLRSLGPSSDCANTVKEDGNAWQYSFQNHKHSIRPAMWVDLSAISD
ncbi:MAG: leucine-rich repeat domain-containing protein [Clostridiales bacterium]|nr:leucine-rich repeat domain-containing protein [Clostridiales bacterium]